MVMETFFEAGPCEDLVQLLEEELHLLEKELLYSEERLHLALLFLK